LLLRELFRNGYCSGRKPKQQADGRDADSGKYTQRGSRFSRRGEKEIRRGGVGAVASG
jgi:hypothetical protein